MKILQPSLDSVYKESLKSEQVKLLYAAMPIALLATLVNAIILVAVMWEVTDHYLATIWLSCMISVTLARFVLTLVYDKANPEPAQARHWELYFSIGSVVTGILWGSTALFLFPESSVMHQVFVAFVVGGMCAGSVTSLSPLLIPIFSFCALALGPLIIRFFTLDSDINNAMGMMLVLFLVMVLSSALRIYRNISQNIALRMQSEHQEEIILAKMIEHEALEEQLLQSQKMEAIGSLVGGIAHEFNNMLAGMTGSLYLAKKEIADFPHTIKKLDNVERLSFRASAMIKKLLIFAKQDGVEKKPLGLTSFIKETAHLNALNVPDNITFHSNICDDELVVRGDATQLQQVLINLLNNACDAVENASSPTVSLQLEAMQSDDGFIASHPAFVGVALVHLAIRDNGCGMSSTDKEHIFEPFFTTKEIGRGTGLGLSMAYGAIQNLGGLLEVESVLGEGSCFHIYLPRIEEEVATTVLEYLSDTVHGKGELILLVDDNLEIRQTSKAVLESLSYRVLVASDGVKVSTCSAPTTRIFHLLLWTL
ncbi:MAG: ATP-binding protein [Mariprofundaceae bacterium]